MLKADLVLIACNVLTMNSIQPYAEAVAIKGDKIIKVGTKEEMERCIGKKTKILELKEQTIVPGLIDTHLHIADFGRFLTWLDLNGIRSIKEMQKIIKNRVKAMPQDKWILGQGWNQTSFSEKRIPNVQDLDEAAPNHPIVLYHQSGCMCVVNSTALKLACITKETIAPSGGIIEHDLETGVPTGVLRENAMNLIWKVIPEPDEKEAFDATCLACEKIVEAGITSVHWIVSSWNEIRLIQRLRAENKLPLRVYIMFPIDIIVQITSLRSCKNFDNDWIRIGGVNVVVDGSLAARTASLKRPYNDDVNTKGKLLYTQKAFRELVAKLHTADFHLTIHAMGDRALELVVSTLEKTLQESPKENHRYRIEYAAVLNKELIHRIKNLKVVIAVQPRVINSEFASWSAIARLGAERARWLYPLRTLIKEAILVSGGSDCPMEPINPFLGIQAAVTRQFFPEEQITIDDALRMYTINAAYVSSDEDIKGTIEENKLADLTVISHDPRTILPNQIAEIEVKATIIGGKIVYSK